MSYRIRLCLTHIISASVAGFSVWYGLQMSGPGRIACTILYAAGAAVPVAIAAWWFTLGLRRLEVRLTTTSANSLRPGLPELDALEERVCESLTRQRALGRDVEELLKQLAPPDTSGSSVPDGSLLSDTLSALARSSTQDVGRILAFAADISRGAHDAHLGAQEQGRTVAQTIKSVEELSGNIDRVAHNAQAASTAATEVRESAAKGKELVQELICGMERIRSHVEVDERKVLALGERSQAIGSIVETMGAISSRTDMLALNASIEAVRAGQEGRGFSVVAEEVRRLAESTAGASREITELVEAIRMETQDTIATMADERRQVQEEVLRVNEAGVALEHISRTSADSAERVGEISQATKEQLRGTHEVVRAMQQVSKIADRIQERADGIRRTTGDLSAAAQGLEDGISPIYHFDQAASLPVQIGDRRSNELDVTRTDADRCALGTELVGAVENQEFIR